MLRSNAKIIEKPTVYKILSYICAQKKYLIWKKKPILDILIEDVI